MASPTRWTCVWVNSGNWWWTGRTCMLQSMGSQRVGQDWETELNWTLEICDQAVFFSGDAISLWGMPVFQHLASLALSNTYVIDCDDQKCSPQNFQGPSREPSHSHWEALGTSHKIMVCFSSATRVLVGNRKQSGLMCVGFDRQEHWWKRGAGELRVYVMNWSWQSDLLNNKVPLLAQGNSVTPQWWRIPGHCSYTFGHLIDFWLLWIKYNEYTYTYFWADICIHFF